ncbi:MAG: hypothetical protein J3R72DRAFT_429084 [Linnemannia gamsii]|nr:MAG: hypothetical protein J3R72DRAFT_429084 [Linnemannia gamsii]
MSSCWIIRKCRILICCLSFFTTLINLIWLIKITDFLNTHNLPDVGAAPLDGLILNVTFGPGIVSLYHIKSGHFKPRTRIWIHAVVAVALLGYFVTYLVLWTVFIVDLGRCSANKGMCFLEHLGRHLGLTLAVLVVLELVASMILLDDFDMPKKRPGRPIPIRSRPRPASAPTRPTPVISLPSPSQPQQKPKQQKQVKVPDQQSILSSATTLQGEDSQTDKDTKRHSTVTILTFNVLEIDSYPEQTHVPNPSSGNVRSTPNQGQ